MQITSLDYSSYLGRIAIGRITRGSITSGQQVMLMKRDGSRVKSKVKELYIFSGLGKLKVEKVNCGDICAVMGVEGFDIGDTIADIENPESMAPIHIDEPTMSMIFTTNTSPFFGKEGKHVTSQKFVSVYIKSWKKSRFACRRHRSTGKIQCVWQRYSSLERFD